MFITDSLGGPPHDIGLAGDVWICAIAIFTKTNDTWEQWNAEQRVSPSFPTHPFLADKVLALNISHLCMKWVASVTTRGYRMKTKWNWDVVIRIPLLDVQLHRLGNNNSILPLFQKPYPTLTPTDISLILWTLLDILPEENVADSAEEDIASQVVRILIT